MARWSAGRPRPQDERVARPHTAQNYSVATASLSTKTFRCVVTSLCSLIGTMNSPIVLSGSCS